MGASPLEFREFMAAILLPPLLLSFAPCDAWCHLSSISSMSLTNGKQDPMASCQIDLGPAAIPALPECLEMTGIGWKNEIPTLADRHCRNVWKCPELAGKTKSLPFRPGIAGMSGNARNWLEKRNSYPSRPAISPPCAEPAEPLMSRVHCLGGSLDCPTVATKIMVDSAFLKRHGRSGYAAGEQGSPD